MRTAFSFCYLAIFLMFVPTVNGQLPTTDHKLDSILLTGNPEAAITYWSTVCSPAPGESSTTTCEIIAERLQNLLDLVTVLKTQKPAYIKELIANGKTQSENYKESYAGPSAARAYQAFLAATEKDDLLKAITYLQTARFFKIPFLKQTLADA